MLLQNNRDTICAITTPIGIGAIAGIRIAGKNTLTILNKILPSTPAKDKIIHTYIYDKDKVIDEVILFFRKSPNTYTGCDEAEIFCHGGLAVPEIIIELLIKNGCRMAGNGEFTQRAFLNGKIDLVQAESVMDIVNAKTKDAAISAISMLKGDFSNTIDKLRNKLLTISSLIEANLDFPEEEDINFDKDQALCIISEAEDRLKNLIIKDENNILMKRGLTVIITGKPNVGKSSLFNLLLSREKAIVTNIPGTTRDILEGWINIRGIPILIKDTAGIRITDDPIERIGIEKTEKEIENAHIVLALFDSSRHFDSDDKLHLKFLKNAKNIFYILTKSDLKGRFEENELPRIEAKIDCRDKTSEGIINSIISTFIENKRFSLNLNDRITEKLKNAEVYLKKTRLIIENNEGLELASEEIKEAIINLSSVTGDITTDDILNNIFSSFCIGK